MELLFKDVGILRKLTSPPPPTARQLWPRAIMVVLKIYGATLAAEVATVVGHDK